MPSAPERGPLRAQQSPEWHQLLHGGWSHALAQSDHGQHVAPYQAARRGCERHGLQRDHRGQHQPVPVVGLILSPRKEQAMRRKNGFTLIELLVVIAIIAILAAILFPV